MLAERVQAGVVTGVSLAEDDELDGKLDPPALELALMQQPQARRDERRGCRAEVLGNGKGADIYVQSDAKEGIEALEAALEKRGFKQTGYRTGETLERLSNMYEDRTEFVYILTWPDLATKEEAWRRFMADEEWKEIKRVTRAKHGDLVGEIEDRVLMPV